MMFLGEQQDAREVDDEVIKNFLIFRFGHFDQRLPELEAIGLVFEDDALQFLVGLPHEPSHHGCDFLVLGSQGVDEQFHDSATLLL